MLAFFLRVSSDLRSISVWCGVRILPSPLQPPDAPCPRCSTARQTCVHAEGPILSAPHLPSQLSGILLPLASSGHLVPKSPPAPEMQSPQWPPDGSTSAQTTPPSFHRGYTAGLSRSGSRCRAGHSVTWFVRKLLLHTSTPLTRLPGQALPPGPAGTSPALRRLSCSLPQPLTEPEAVPPVA